MRNKGSSQGCQASGDAGEGGCCPFSFYPFPPTAFQSSFRGSILAGRLSFPVPFPESQQASCQMRVQNSLGWTHINITVPTGTVPSTKARRCLMSHVLSWQTSLYSFPGSPCCSATAAMATVQAISSVPTLGSPGGGGWTEFWGGTHGQDAFNAAFAMLENRFLSTTLSKGTQLQTTDLLKRFVAN